MSDALSTPPTVSLYHLQNTTYLHTAIASIWIWDTLSSLPREYEAFHARGRRMALPDFAYILSRIVTGGLVLGDLICTVRPYAGCNRAPTILAWLGAIAIPLNTLLFLIRADAVFKRHNKSRVVFGTLWLSTLATFTAPFCFIPSPVEILGGFCPIVQVKKMVSAGAITVALFDTVVFFSITFHIISISNFNKYGSLSLKSTGRVSKTLLLTGQLYYVPVFMLNTLIIAVVLSSSVEAPYQHTAVFFDIVFQNIMTCQVFRLLRLGILYEDPKICSDSMDSVSNIIFENV